MSQGFPADETRTGTILAPSVLHHCCLIGCALLARRLRKISTQLWEFAWPRFVLSNLANATKGEYPPSARCEYAPPDDRLHRLQPALIICKPNGRMPGDFDQRGTFDDNNIFGLHTQSPTEPAIALSMSCSFTPEWTVKLEFVGKFPGDSGPPFR